MARREERALLFGDDVRGVAPLMLRGVERARADAGRRAEVFASDGDGDDGRACFGFGVSAASLMAVCKTSHAVSVVVAGGRSGSVRAVRASPNDVWCGASLPSALRTRYTSRVFRSALRELFQQVSAVPSACQSP